MGIRKFFYDLFFGKAKPTPPVSPRTHPVQRPVAAPVAPASAPAIPSNSAPDAPSPQEQTATQVMLDIYGNQIEAFFKTLSETPDSLNLPKLSGLQRYLQATKLDWKSPDAFSAHLKRLPMKKLYDLMELIGYEVHHVLPVDTFDLSWAFREHFENYRGSDRIAFNAEFIPGQTPDQIMLNALHLFNKMQLSGGKVFGVHDVHPDYNVAISRYLDLRRVEIIADLKFQIDASGIKIKPADFEKAVENHFQEELLKFTRKIRSRLIDASVRGTDGQYVEVNALFGSHAELQKDEAFLRRMKNLQSGLP